MTATVGTVGVADLDDLAAATDLADVADAAHVRSRLHGVRDAEHAWLHTIGRHTGRSHSTKVCFAAAASSVHVLAHRRPGGAPADWYRNLVAAGVTSLHIAGLALTATVVVPDDEPGAHRLVVDLLGEKYGPAMVSGWHADAAALPLRLDVHAVARVAPTATAAASWPGSRP